MKDEEKDYMISSQRHTIDVIMARQQHVISHANITITDLKKQKPANWRVMVEILENIVRLANHSYTYEQIVNQKITHYNQ
jgi:ethanolamine utilization protein EutA (predicted chaperonin)